MNRYIKRIITGMIVLTMIFSGFTGIGTLVVKAASDTLSIQVLEGNQPVGCS